MPAKPVKTEAAGQRHLRMLETVLLGLCLCILALRITYTEGPAGQMLLLAGSVADVIYSLTLSGLLIFSLVLWLLWRILSNRLTYRVTGLELGLVLFGAAAVISTVVASDKRSAITQSMMLLGPILAAVLLTQVLDSPARIRVLLTVIAALGVVSAYQCAEQFFVSNSVTIEQYEKDPKALLDPLGIEAGTFQQFLFEHRLYSRGVRGFFTTSNSAASFAVMASFAALALLVRRSPEHGDRPAQRRHTLLLSLGTVVIVAGLLLTQSKGGILAFLIGLVVCAILVGLDRKLGARKRVVLALMVPSVLVAGAVVGCAAVLYGLQHDRLPGGNSMLVRWQYWRAATRMYADHPLTGVGPGNFSNYYPHYKPAAALESVSDPHSFLLSLLAQYGPLGLLGFLAMLALPLWRSVTFSTRTTASDDTPVGPPFKPLAVGMLAVVGICLLLVRPILMPVTGADDPGVLLYEIVAMYMAPVAAFFIGFLLVSAALEDRRGWQTGFTRAALLAAPVSAVLAVLLHNLIDFALFEPGVWLTFWFLLACLIAARLQRSPSRAFGPPPEHGNVGVAAPRPKALGRADDSVAHVPKGHSSAFGTPQEDESIQVASAKPKAWPMVDGRIIGKLPLATAARLLAARFYRDGGCSSSIRRSRFVKAAALGASIVLLGSYIHFVWQPVCDTTVAVQRAYAAVSAGRFDEAHHLLNATMKSDPLAPVIPSINGRMYVHQYEQTAGKQPALLREAARCFGRAIEVNPADYQNYERLALVYDRLGEDQAAYDWYGKAARLYPGCDRLWFELARTADRLGKTREALDHYRRAVEIEDAYRRQFRQMYPDREKIISRLGEPKYQRARQRIQELSGGL
jgi:O-antigen ligase/tetratricopeptide (TPR) repeat protein